MSKLRTYCRAGIVFCLVAIAGVLVFQSDEYTSCSAQRAAEATSSAASAAPTFYRDVLPILRQHCQACHHRGGIAPMSFETYEDARRYALIIRNVTRDKAMPPSFAIPFAGHVSNDPSLTAEQISALAAWANLKGPAGDPRDAPPTPSGTAPWSISKPDLIVRMPQPVALPANGDVDCTYEIVPTHLSEDRWVRMAQVLPSLPENVRQAVVFVRRRGSGWLRHAPMGKPFTIDSLTNDEDRHWRDDDILAVYAPGSSSDEWAAPLAKFIPAGADLIFRLQYITNGLAGADQTSIGLVFSKQRPAQRVITLLLANDRFSIPAGVSDYKVEAQGVLVNDVVLLSMFPYMHQRGKRFEYDIVHTRNATGNEPESQIEVLLGVTYDLRWQPSYRLAEPRFLKAGTKLRAVAWYDNSPNNPQNPDPNVSVGAGGRARDEVLLGFLDVAVPARPGTHSNMIRQQ